MDLGARQVERACDDRYRIGRNETLAVLDVVQDRQQRAWHVAPGGHDARDGVGNARGVTAGGDGIWHELCLRTVLRHPPISAFFYIFGGTEAGFFAALCDYRTVVCPFNMLFSAYAPHFDPPHLQIRDDTARTPAPALDVSRLVALLGHIEATGNIAQSAEAVSLSYRYAWGILRDAETLFGGALIAKTRARIGADAAGAATRLGQQAHCRAAVAHTGKPGLGTRDRTQEADGRVRPGRAHPCQPRIRGGRAARFSR
jgi:molybdate transport repressor ModE-like protein